jgi:hypothetical protein
VRYFQRYSQKENVVTNNTLLLFSRLYHHSPLTFEKFLTALMEGTESRIVAGVKFTQQIRTKNAVPDGMIQQMSFRVVVETKLYGNPLMDQLENHLNSFEDPSIQVKVLLLIDNELPDELMVDKIKARIDKSGKYIGLYAAKQVKAIGQIENIVTAEYDYDTKQLKILESDHDITTDQEQRIIGAIEAAYLARKWNLARNHKFFLVKSFEETALRMRNPVLGKRYINSKNFFPGALPDVKAIADFLKEGTFE